MISDNHDSSDAQFSTDDEPGPCPLCGGERESDTARYRIELHDSADSSIGFTDTRLCGECWYSLYHDVLNSAGGASA